MQCVYLNFEDCVVSLVMEYCTTNQRRLIILVIIFGICMVFYLGFFCPEKVCALTTRNPTPDYARILLPHVNGERPVSLSPNSEAVQKLRSVDEKFSIDDLAPKVEFDIRGSDVIVFLHIQKTGGTSFGRHLVQDLDLEKPCDCQENRKRCKCTRPNSENSFWLFSRYSTGWQCGLHADWTELTNCVDGVLDQREGPVKRRYFYVTLLREPVQRFLSEFLHVQRGATWKHSRHWCGGHEASPEELPSCFPGETWEDVTLEEFMACPFNLAFNRQTRMLADLSLVGCYNASALSPADRDAAMLASAQENLLSMGFFGLCEYQKVNQYLFEKTFDLRFMTAFQQFNETHVAAVLRTVTPEQLERIRQLNRLDIELYKYAQSLLMQRFEFQKKHDPNFRDHFYNLGHLKSGGLRFEDLED